MIKEENSLGRHWSRLQDLFEYEDMCEDFQDIMMEKGVDQFESTQYTYELYHWIIKCSDNKVVMFHDPGDGMYLYIYNGTKDELIKLMDETYNYVVAAHKRPKEK